MTNGFIITGVRMVVIMLQILLPAHILAFSFKKRSHYVLRVIMTSTALLAYAFFIHSLDSENAFLYVTWSSVYYYLFFVLVNFTIFICYEMDFRATVFLAIIAYTSQHLLYLVFSIFDQLLIDNYTFKTIFFSYVFVRRFFWTVLLVPFAYIIGKRLKNNPDIILPSSLIFTVSFIAVLGDMIVSSMSMTDFLSKPLSKNPSFYSTKLFNIIVCILILLFALAKADQNTIEKENQYIRQLNAEQSKLYQVNKETINLINLKAHDLKHQIRHLYRDKESISEESLHEMENILSIYDTHLKTGREALDIILQEKGLTCKSKGIDFKCMIDAKSLEKIHDNDLYSLFGNILDNAIEASSQCESDKWISLKIKTMGNLTLIQEENSFVGELEFKDNLPQTTKADRSYHGFGVKSIKYIVEKYQGTLSMKAKDNIFTCMISFEIC